MSNQPTVFVVDDDQAMRNSLQWLIESVGMNVETYDSADEFIRNYYPGRAGCLLLDVRMPGMSGLEVLQAIRTRQPELPVVLALPPFAVETAWAYRSLTEARSRSRRFFSSFAAATASRCCCGNGPASIPGRNSQRTSCMEAVNTRPSP